MTVRTGTLTVLSTPTLVPFAVPSTDDRPGVTLALLNQSAVACAWGDSNVTISTGYPISASGSGKDELFLDLSGNERIYLVAASGTATFTYGLVGA